MNNRMQCIELTRIKNVGTNSFALFMNQQCANKFAPTSG